MPYLDLQEYRVYYETEGEGEILILLHHGFGCTLIWSEIYPTLVEAGYKVVMYDRRGFGRSGKGKDFMEFYTSEDRYRPESVEELKELKDALGIGRCHLIGQCEGGVTSLDYAAEYPEEIESVTISSTQCYCETTQEEMNDRIFQKPFRDLDTDMREKLTKWHGDFAEEFFEQFRVYGGAYGRYYYDIRPVLTHVQCPVLILYPDRSSLFPVEQAVGFYRRLLFGELMVLPGCGHNTYEQEPEEYARAVLKFLKRQKSSRRQVRLTCAA